MKLQIRTLLGLASLLFCGVSLHAQDIAAGRQYGQIQAGAGYLYLNNDYTDKAGQGISAWADYDIFRLYHIEIGAEAEVHLGGIETPDDIGENSYLIGPRFGLYRKHKLNIYGKPMFGRGTITNQLYNTSSSFNLYAFGGGVDYRVARKYNVRAEVEEQKWPNFEPHTLSPIAFSVGVLYVIR